MNSETTEPKTPVERFVIVSSESGDRVTCNDRCIGFRVEGRLYLQRCPSCWQENYAANARSGICTWCGWSEHAVDVDPSG